ncbi:hypothetical protein [Crassaminicella indica]|uniref:DUF4350 domain-containing protein n=1 Tax=Crassaminicella indica TaxID=2855394 RepID=A0ABX8RH49_9CLOT|nr:hypothetical protein [Crassaminicella indica]QXM06276.1 hypothetical protein KVH43_00065 [Crassaminicella indica]
MKKRKIIGIVALLIISIYVINRFHVIDQSIGKVNKSNESLPLNTSKEGVSIYYDTLKALGYPVAIDASYFLVGNADDIYIITENKQRISFKLEDAEDFIKEGGKLIYLTDRYKEYKYSNPLEQYKEKAYVYALGKGKLVIGDIQLITNETIIKDKGGAYFILKAIEAFKGNIYFNEYYRFIKGQTPSLYRNLPFYAKIILFQLILVIVGCIVYLGKRFGKAKRIVDEIERDENEYLYAAANLYEKGQCIDTIYDTFSTELKSELNKTFKRKVKKEEVIDLWGKYCIPHKEKALRVFNSQSEIKNPKDYMSIIKDMDELIQMLVKRREEGWKRLKQRNSLELSKKN